MLPSVTGTELAQTLLKDGADSRAVSQAIKAMEKAGVNDTVIRKAAKELTAEEFSRVGRLTKKGLTLELLEKAVDNKAVLEKVSDETLLLFKKSAKSADEIITVLERHGDEAGRLYELYGDEVIDLALKYGDEGLDGVRKHGSDFMVEYHAYGDEFVENYLKYGDEAVDAYVKYGADAADVLKGGNGSNIIEFPSNPEDFNPEGLTKIGPFETKNGKIIKWIDENKKAVFEWDEDLKYGSHYHVIGDDGNTRLPNSSGETHFLPGDTFEK